MRPCCATLCCTGSVLRRKLQALAHMPRNAPPSSNRARCRPPPRHPAAACRALRGAALALFCASTALLERGEAERKREREGGQEGGRPPEPTRPDRPARQRERKEPSYDRRHASCTMACELLALPGVAGMLLARFPAELPLALALCLEGALEKDLTRICQSISALMPHNEVRWGGSMRLRIGRKCHGLKVQRTECWMFGTPAVHAAWAPPLAALASSAATVSRARPGHGGAAEGQQGAFERAGPAGCRCSTNLRAHSRKCAAW